MSWLLSVACEKNGTRIIRFFFIPFKFTWINISYHLQSHIWELQFLYVYKLIYTSDSEQEYNQKHFFSFLMVPTNLCMRNVLNILLKVIDERAVLDIQIKTDLSSLTQDPDTLQFLLLQGKHNCLLPEERILRNQNLQPQHTCSDPAVYCSILRPCVLQNVLEMCEDMPNLLNQKTSDHFSVLNMLWTKTVVKSVRSKTEFIM